MSTTVIHRRDMASYPKGAAVYIGRPGRWGNPYPISETCSRGEAIALYREHLTRELADNPGLISTVQALRGKALACYCAPRPCHGDVLAEFAEMPLDALHALVDQAKAGQG